MPNKRCSACGGSGLIRGGGMIEQDCRQCQGSGQIEYVTDEIKYLTEKQTQKYSDAIDEIKRETNLNNEDAEKLLDKQIRKIKREKRA